jgi:hypothetical protein
MRGATQRAGRLAGLAVAACLMCAGTGSADLAARQPARAGTLQVTFLYMPPTTIDPTYHTAIWLEDGEGRLVRTLYVSQELSSAEYKMGNVCPDWVKVAHWGTTPKSEVDAVTAPTPNVGSEAKVFDLAQLGVKPGLYQFRFQMHVGEDHNVLFRGTLNAGDVAGDLQLEMTQGPGELVSTDQFIREVKAHYAPASK